MSRATRGSIAFRKVCDDRKQVVVASELGEELGRKIHQGSVTGWANGKNIPNGDVMVAMHSLYSIRLEWWTEAATKQTKRRAA